MGCGPAGCDRTAQWYQPSFLHKGLQPPGNYKHVHGQARCPKNFASNEPTLVDYKERPNLCWPNSRD